MTWPIILVIYDPVLGSWSWLPMFHCKKSHSCYLDSQNCFGLSCCAMTMALAFLTLSCHQLVSNALQLLLKYLLSKLALQKDTYLKWRIKIQFYHITAVNTAMQRNLLFFILHILSQKILLAMEAISLISSSGSKAENRHSTALPSRQKWRKIRALVLLRSTGKSYRCLLQLSFLR